VCCLDTSTLLKTEASWDLYTLVNAFVCTYVRTYSQFSAKCYFIAVSMFEITDNKFLGVMLRNEIGDGWDVSLFRYHLSYIICHIIVQQSSVNRELF
jgi:hypothetical protein